MAKVLSKALSIKFDLLNPLSSIDTVKISHKFATTKYNFKSKKRGIRDEICNYLNISARKSSALETKS